jgi:hypothetical protein
MGGFEAGCQPSVEPHTGYQRDYRQRSLWEIGLASGKEGMIDEDISRAFRSQELDWNINQDAYGMIPVTMVYLRIKSIEFE